MRMKCRDRWTELVDFAEGKPSAEVEAHLATCPECAKEVTRLQRAFAAGRLAHESAPEDVVARAKSLMPFQRKVFRLVRSSLQFSAARAVSQAFQALYEMDDAQIRVAYTQTESGWEVVSQLPATATRVKHGSTLLETDHDGRFFFVVRELEDAGFTILKGSTFLEVPSPDEAARGLE